MRQHSHEFDAAQEVDFSSKCANLNLRDENSVAYFVRRCNTFFAGCRQRLVPGSPFVTDCRPGIPQPSRYAAFLCSTMPRAIFRRQPKHRCIAPQA